MCRIHTFAIAISLFLMPVAAVAGQYVAGTTSELVMSETGSGGGWIVTPGSGTITGGAGGGAGVPGSSASASGTITTTFTWQRNLIYGGEEDPNDNPPANAIIVESCTIDSTAAQYGGSCDVTADCGLKTPYDPNGPIPTGGYTSITPVYLDDTDQIVIGYQFDCHSSATQPRIVPGAETITVNYDTVSASAYSTDGPYDIQVSYSATVSPVKLSVTGTVYGGGGIMYGEVGRKNTGDFFTGAPGCTLKNWAWTVGGSNTFKSYEHDSLGLVTYLTSSDLEIETPFWYWIYGQQENVQATAEVYYNNVKIGTVNDQQEVTVESPFFKYYDHATSNVSAIVNWGLEAAGDPSFVDSHLVPEGIIYNYGGFQCPHFPNGLLFSVQLLDEDDHFLTMPDSVTTTNGDFYLDSGDYPFRSNISTTDFSTALSVEDYDAPSATIGIPATVTVSTLFRVYFMYRSSDQNEQDVPVYYQTWDWSGTNTSTPPASPSLVTEGPNPVHPVWSHSI